MTSRFDVASSLSWTWDGDDLSAPVEHFIAIARAPSLTKDALSIGWLEGDLVEDGTGLRGTLRLSDAGRQAVLDFRSISR